MNTYKTCKLRIFPTDLCLTSVCI